MTGNPHGLAQQFGRGRVAQSHTWPRAAVRKRLEAFSGLAFDTAPCWVCGEPGQLQVRAPMPTWTNANGWIVQ
jgi:hypothetical protein